LDWYINPISKIEFLAFSNLKVSDRDLFFEFLEMVEIIDLTNADTNLLRQILNIRIINKLKLPDAIILATATVNNTILLTRDRVLLNIENIPVEKF